MHFRNSLPRRNVFSCSILTMCSPKKDYYYVNRNTQLALFSLCIPTCAAVMSIRWTIHHGYTNSTTSTVQWTPVSSLSPWIFGKHSLELTSTSVEEDAVGMNAKNLTVTRDLFAQHNESLYWRFDVIYSFDSVALKRTFAVELNEAPRNGSCLIHPPNGTLMTLFTVECQHWFDHDQIKDYSFYSLHSPRAH